MTGTPAEVVRRHLDAFSSGDLEAFLATVSPTARFVTGSTVVAPETFPEFFGWAMRELSPEMTVTSLVAERGLVACEFVETITTDGQRQSLERAAFYRVEGELITSARVYDVRD